MERDAIDYRVHYAGIDAVLAGGTRVAFDMGEWSDGRAVTGAGCAVTLPLP